MKGLAGLCLYGKLPNQATKPETIAKVIFLCFSKELNSDDLYGLEENFEEIRSRVLNYQNRL